MVFIFPPRPLADFAIRRTSLDSHPTLDSLLPFHLYRLEGEDNNAWTYFQFRLLSDVPKNVADWTICSDFVAAKRFHGEDFSALVVGVWTGVFPAALQTALFHAGHTAYTLFKGKRTSLDTAWSLGKGVARSYVTFNCPRHLEDLDHYLTIS